MTITAARQELILAADSRVSVRRRGSVFDSIQSELREVVPSGHLERITLSDAGSGPRGGWSADYSGVSRSLAAFDARRSIAARPLSSQAPEVAARPRNDPTVPYSQTLDAVASLPKGTLLDVLA